MSKSAQISLLARGHYATQLSSDAMKSVNELVFKLANNPSATFEQALDSIEPENREEMIKIELLKSKARNVNELN